MLLMAEKGIREGICHAIYRYAKANNKYMKKYDKNKESSYFKYWDVNNLSLGNAAKAHSKLFLVDQKILLNLMKIS